MPTTEALNEVNIAIRNFRYPIDLLRASNSVSENMHQHDELISKIEKIENAFEELKKFITETSSSTVDNPAASELQPSSPTPM
ncbi:hypothetical protein Gasu2_17670 [Galdieria sulphuraria]|nr:hypothetical protein Gasu2_17670 [Galdieria sulphuraria]